MNDDIEILDIFDNDKKKEEIKPTTRIPKNFLEDDEPKVKNNFNNKKGKKKKLKPKAKLWQIIFCGVSFLFILGCIIYYGSRFIKYYRIYNPKVDTTDGSVLLAKDISGNSEIVYEGAGLYISSGNYIYKGNVKNNYLKYNNLLWRIIKVNVDNTIEIVLDDYINIMPWNKEVTSFKNSEIHQYLNNEFLNNLDKDMLVTNSFCEDEVSDLSNIKCEKINNESYVKLLDITGFLNSVKNKETYLTSSDEIFWLSDNNENKIWHTNGSNVSQSDANTFYEVRPVVKLKNTVTYTSGDGTKDNPYVVGKEDKLKLGSTVILGEDKWIVYDINENVKLMRAEVLDKQLSFDKNKLTYDDKSEGSLAEYLNTTYLESLSYKDMIVNSTWYVGGYKDKVSDVKNETIKTKVGIPNILDIKFNSSIKGYFTSTSNDEHIYVYENPLRPSKPTTYRSIRPCIAITKSDANKLKYVDGVFKVEG